ncbi:MAG: ankyrin repeat domain-containing protein [Parachlamydiaceae bacterium]|nr:ankyrin repeat domain-containing protein [Parachlamydiaceae bacterium]
MVNPLFIKEVNLYQTTEYKNIEKRPRLKSKIETDVDNQKENLFQGSTSSVQIRLNKRKTEKDAEELTHQNVNKKLPKIALTLTSDSKYHKKITDACKKHNLKLDTYEEFMQGTRFIKMSVAPVIKLTSILKAVENNDSSMLKVLKDLGGDLNQSEINGNTPLTQAVIKNQKEMVRLLANLGADLDQSDGDQDTPLTRAVIGNNADIVRLLATLGADLDRSDSDGRTPLTRAVIENQKDMVIILAELGADLNCSDAKEDTPMNKAIIEGDKEMIKLLAELGADLNQSASDGETPMTTALIENRPASMKLLLELGADPKLTEEILMRGFLGNVWGLKGATVLQWTYVLKDATTKTSNTEINLEGYSSRLLMKKFVPYVSNFLNSINLNKNGITEKQKEEIEDSFINAFPLSKKSVTANIARIQAGQPFVILGGSEGHAVSIVIHKNRLIVFNRGEGGSESSAQIYKLLATDVTKETLKNLIKEYSDMDSFNQMIIDLDLTFISEFTQKDQEVGNCTWASSKGALKSLLILLTNKRIGNKIYKQFTAFAREKSLSDYFENSTNYSHEILEKIQEKLSKKSGLAASKELIENYFSEGTL